MQITGMRPDRIGKKYFFHFKNHVFCDDCLFHLKTQGGNISSNSLRFVPATQPCDKAGVNNTPF